jgi:tripartite-type tricarboxylate transporter receptor subunit TctC
LRERLAMLGYEPVGSTPEEFGQGIQTEIATWAKVIKAANIRQQ